MSHKVETEWAGRPISLESGRLAGQADGAVLVRYGDTVILATVVRSDNPSTLDFFPLTVQYEERMYAAGKIPGGFIKREGRPSENATLSARLTDRPLRPLFPKGYRYEVQIVVTVMSTDQENEPDLLAIVGASAALMVSDIPFSGPVGAARVGYIDGQYVLNPTADQREVSLLDLTVAGTREAVMMVEGSAHELPEEVMLGAVEFGHRGLQDVLNLQEQLAAEDSKPKQDFIPPAPDEGLAAQVRDAIGGDLRAALYKQDKSEREAAIAAVRERVAAQVAEAAGSDADTVRPRAAQQFEAQLKEEVRNAILTEGLRPDGRRPDEIRPVSAEVGILPRTHGSAVFTRGQTQVVSVTTLGTRREEQMLDGLGLEESKRFMHHYNFPPYSTGEAKPMRGPSRRDIGHGALVERSVLPVMPTEQQFPYTVRVVSEVVSSNGSSSMASVCGTTLALMDAGVPIKAPVSGIAMGLITGGPDRHVVLSDIQGMEDALGDMDFKVAGTSSGVTGLQMDIKTTGVSFAIMRQAFEQAREGRMFILERMLTALRETRQTLSGYAPRIITLKINPEKIGAVIGPGGKVIRGITEATGAKIDIEDDGTVLIYSSEAAAAEDARRRIEGIAKDIEPGQTYTGKIVRIMPYGAFVEIAPGKDGLLHVSEMAETRVERVEDLFKEGDEVTVMVTDVDRNGKVSLSRRAVLTGEMPSQRQREPAGARPGPRGPMRGDQGPVRGGFGQRREPGQFGRPSEGNGQRDEE